MSTGNGGTTVSDQTPLVVDRLTAGYDGAAVLREFSLTVGAGEVVALLGANGAGKTTALRAISGLVRPMEGMVSFLGRDISSVAPQALAQMGLVHVPDTRGVFFTLTVDEHFRLSGADADQVKTAFEYFPALQALRGRKGGLLSGGEQQMLALALALVREPKLLLLDELSLGLAPVIVERLLPIVRRFADDHGAAVLVVEQHVHLVLAIADRAVVLRHGHTVLEEDAETLRADQTLLTRSYLGENAPASA